MSRREYSSISLSVGLVQCQCKTPQVKHHKDSYNISNDTIHIIIWWCVPTAYVVDVWVTHICSCLINIRSSHILFTYISWGPSLGTYSVVWFIWCVPHDNYHQRLFKCSLKWYHHSLFPVLHFSVYPKTL